MTAATIEAKKQFLANLENHYFENLKGISPLLQSIRKRAWDHFLQLGLPEKNQEAFQYLPLNQLYLESFELGTRAKIVKEKLKSFIYPECRRRVVVFENGQYIPELSDTTALPEEIIIMALKDSFANYGSFLQGRLVKTLKEETDPFATLNIALIQMGLFVYVPPNVKITEPIQCLHISSNDSPAIFSPRIYFFLGKSSTINWLTTHGSLRDGASLSNSVLDISLDEGAEFHQVHLVNPSYNSWHFGALRANLKKQSQFKSLSYTSGAKSVRQDFRLNLLGENASADIKGVSLLKENHHSHVNVHLHHEAPNCDSSQHFKNVLDEISRSSFTGKIFVEERAQKTNAYQLNKNLILSEKAISNSKPGLEIFADDVKASHGATVSQLQDDQLHYLKTRGLSASLAKQLLVSGFCFEILGEIPYGFVKDKLRKTIESAIRLR